MVENAKAPCRGRGRPQTRTDEETLALIVEAAREEFMGSGYAATSMCSVAQRAGVSTKTLYRLVPAKDALFERVIADRIGRFILEIDKNALNALGLEEALERILNAFGRLTLDRQTINLTRLVFSESERFPEVGQAFYEAAVRRSGDAIALWLKDQCAKGALELDDPQLAAAMLRGMMIMEPQRAVMMGQREAPEAEEIVRRAKICARLFLNGCRKQPA
ncbi:TetR/AcrR family transcriptional regulator [Rhodoblastus sp.]|uniref:TetR/AcrR family transcriptional regulator n=1 Tax=Rhodoblastus sp. TaxID=1962975 RepID=UPI0035B29F84